MKLPYNMATISCPRHHWLSNENARLRGGRENVLKLIV